jgi:hypothetical protein
MQVAFHAAWVDYEYHGAPWKDTLYATIPSACHIKVSPCSILQFLCLC